MQSTGPKTPMVSQETISKLATIDRKLFSREELFHIDLLLFSYYEAGISIADLAYMKMSDIDGDRLNCKDCSYPNADSIPFEKEAMEIVSRYKHLINNGYLLPILGSKHLTKAHKYGRIKRLTQQANYTFRKIEKMLECERITWRGVRLAFVDKQLEDGVSPVALYAFFGSTVLDIFERLPFNIGREAWKRGFDSRIAKGV